jgi:hypothetical protein
MGGLQLTPSFWLLTFPKIFCAGSAVSEYCLVQLLYDVCFAFKVQLTLHLCEAIAF